MPVTLTRRRLLGSLLAAGAVLTTGGLTGCERHGADAQPTPARSAPPDPLLALLAAEEHLVAVYDATLARHPGLSAALTAIRAEHAGHAGALRDALSASASPSPRTPSPTPSASVADVPGQEQQALAAVVAAEREAAKRFGAACLTAPARRAALLGSIAASESAHLVVLA